MRPRRPHPSFSGLSPTHLQGRRPWNALGRGRGCKCVEGTRLLRICMRYCLYAFAGEEALEGAGTGAGMQMRMEQQQKRPRRVAAFVYRLHISLILDGANRVTIPTVVYDARFDTVVGKVQGTCVVTVVRRR